MTLQDLLAREAIRNTMAKYNMSGDRMKADEFAACFAEDGVIEATGPDRKELMRYEGRAAILEWQYRWRDGGTDADPAPSGVSFLRHNLTTCKIDLTGPETANARTYFVVIADNGVDHSGHYVDRFRKEGDDWLIEHRSVRMDWYAPESLFRRD